MQCLEIAANKSPEGSGCKKWLNILLLVIAVVMCTVDIVCSGVQLSRLAWYDWSTGSSTELKDGFKYVKYDDTWELPYKSIVFKSSIIPDDGTEATTKECKTSGKEEYSGKIYFTMNTAGRITDSKLVGYYDFGGGKGFATCVIFVTFVGMVLINFGTIFVEKSCGGWGKFTGVINFEEQGSFTLVKNYVFTLVVTSFFIAPLAPIFSTNIHGDCLTTSSMWDDLSEAFSLLYTWATFMGIVIFFLGSAFLYQKFCGGEDSCCAKLNAACGLFIFAGIIFFTGFAGLAIKLQSLEGDFELNMYYFVYISSVLGLKFLGVSEAE